MGSGRRRDLPGQRHRVRARVGARTLPTTPACPRTPRVIALPAPSPLKRGVARSKVVTAIAVVLTPRVPVRGTRCPRVQLGQLQLEVTSGGSEDQEGKSGHL